MLINRAKTENRALDVRYPMRIVYGTPKCPQSDKILTYSNFRTWRQVFARDVTEEN